MPAACAYKGLLRAILGGKAPPTLNLGVTPLPPPVPPPLEKLCWMWQPWKGVKRKQGRGWLMPQTRPSSSFNSLFSLNPLKLLPTQPWLNHQVTPVLNLIITTLHCFYLHILLFIIYAFQLTTKQFTHLSPFSSSSECPVISKGVACWFATILA